MTTVAKKLQLGTAAFAVAAAAALIAPMVAVADETDSATDTTSTSTSDNVGTSAAKTPKREKRGTKPAASAPATAPSGDASADAAADATGNIPLIQNSLIWVGSPNPNAPSGTTINAFEPLADLPDFARPMYGWMEDFEFEACVLGLSSVTKGQNVEGPYGTSTTGFSTGGC